MSQASKCARHGGTTVQACHYYGCRKHKVCIESPAGAKFLLKPHKAATPEKHIPGPGPSPKPTKKGRK